MNKFQNVTKIEIVFILIGTRPLKENLIRYCYPLDFFPRINFGYKIKMNYNNNA